MLGLQIVTCLNAADSAEAHFDALQDQVPGDTNGPIEWFLWAVIEDRLFDFLVSFLRAAFCAIVVLVVIPLSLGEEF